MPIRLPWWVALAYADVEFWFITVPLAVVLLVAAWCGAHWLGALRFAIYGLAALLLLPFPVTAIIVLHQEHLATRYWRTLEQNETIMGLPLPPGSSIRFLDEARTHLIEIRLSGTADVRGLRLTGRILRYYGWRNIGPIWGVELAEDQQVGDLPCRAGTNFDRLGTILDDNFVVQRCVLARTHTLLGLSLPRGTEVTRGKDARPWQLLLPASAGVFLPMLDTMAPPGVTLTVTQDGRLTQMGSAHGQTIAVRGATLATNALRVEDDAVDAALAGPLTVAGTPREAGTRVRIDLANGEVSVP